MVLATLLAAAAFAGELGPQPADAPAELAASLEAAARHWTRPARFDAGAAMRCFEALQELESAAGVSSGGLQPVNGYRAYQLAWGGGILIGTSAGLAMASWTMSECLALPVDRKGAGDPFCLLSRGGLLLPNFGRLTSADSPLVLELKEHPAAAPAVAADLAARLTFGLRRLLRPMAPQAVLSRARDAASACYAPNS